MGASVVLQLVFCNPLTMGAITGAHQDRVSSNSSDAALQPDIDIVMKNGESTFSGGCGLPQAKKTNFRKRVHLRYSLL